MINASIKRSRCTIKGGCENSEEFRTTTELKQGDALSLFNTIIKVTVWNIHESTAAEIYYYYYRMIFFVGRERQRVTTPVRRLVL